MLVLTCRTETSNKQVAVAGAIIFSNWSLMLRCKGRVALCVWALFCFVLMRLCANLYFVTLPFICGTTTCAVYVGHSVRLLPLLSLKASILVANAAGAFRRPKLACAVLCVRRNAGRRSTFCSRVEVGHAVTGRLGYNWFFLWGVTTSGKPVQPWLSQIQLKMYFIICAERPCRALKSNQVECVCGTLTFTGVFAQCFANRTVTKPLSLPCCSCA